MCCRRCGCLLLQIATPPSVLYGSFWFFLPEKLSIEPLSNKAGISKFLEFNGFQIFWERNSSFSSYWIVSIFFLYQWSYRHIMPLCNKAGIPGFDEFQISLKHYSSLNSYWIILNFFARETRHIEPPDKTRILTFCLEFMKFDRFQISLKWYSSFSSYWIIMNFLPEKLGIECHPVTKPKFAR